MFFVKFLCKYFHEKFWDLEIIKHETKDKETI